MSTFSPGSLAELQQWMESCFQSRQSVHWLTAPGSRPPFDLNLSLDRLNQEVDFPYRDMTITVQAGMTVAALQNVLAGHQQWLPVNVPRPEQTTVAEMIVRHWYGSFVAGYGTVRDWLLGIAAVDGQGRLFHAGGRVVKNVAGYDLCKLLVGSNGELAIPAEVTLQTRPLPESLLLVKFEASTPVEQFSAWEAVRELPLKPVILDVSPAGWSLTVAVEGTVQATATLVQTLEQAACRVNGVQLRSVEAWQESQNCWQQILPEEAPSEQPLRLLRTGVRPSETILLLKMAEQYGWQAVGFSTRGTVLLSKPEPEITEANWQGIQQQLTSLKSTPQLLAGPAPLRQENRELLTKLSAWPLMKKLKTEFDPRCLLQPELPFAADT